MMRTTFILISILFMGFTLGSSSLYGEEASAEFYREENQVELGPESKSESESPKTANQFMEDLMTSLVGKSLQMRFRIVGGEEINYRDHIGINTKFDMTAPIFIKLYDPAGEAEMDPNFKPIAKTGDESRQLSVQIRTLKDSSIEKNQMHLEVSFFEHQKPTYLNFDINMGAFDDPIALKVYSLSGVFNFQTGQSVTVTDGRCKARQKIADWQTQSEAWKEVDCAYSYLYKHQNPRLSQEEKKEEIGSPQFEFSYSSCGKEQC
ncbi:MAG: hypothetical protein OXB88_11100 [Bacteriovoracales bacterium]|nr:hypothetical protein [Bacteriovoracales bacterium]